MHGAERPDAHARDGLPALGEVGEVVSGHVGRARPVGCARSDMWHVGDASKWRYLLKNKRCLHFDTV